VIVMSITDSQEFTPLEEADDFAAETWPDTESVGSESAWDTEEDINWEGYPADEIDEDHAGEGIAVENYSDAEYDYESDDFAELDTYHEPRRAHRTMKAGSALAAAIAQTAEQEYRRWRPSGRKALVETDPAATPILQEYYRTGVGMNVTASQLRSTRFEKSHPWSAVFISWVMKQAGAGTAFAYSPAHQTYIRAARRNRLSANTANPFWAFRATEIAPNVGDLVCTARGDSGATYDNIADRLSRKTHCDVVTAVRPGEIRVVGGNVRQNVGAKVLRTHPDGRLRLDGKQSGYFAVIRCNDAAVPVPPAPQPPPRPAPGPSRQVRAGQYVVDRYALLRDHAGTPPDLVLKWNDMSQPSTIDVVVHLHGWSPGVGGRMNIVRHKLPVSGLDFADPRNPAKVGRTTPTLMILPRGNHDPVGSKTERYTFPALIKPGALQRLVDESLAHFAAQTGATVRRGRLILTAHSGGGAPLMKILGHTDPDEVHTFDALYTDPTPLIAWAQRRIASGTGALRVVYRPGEGTAAYSKRVAQTISSARSQSFRVEHTGVSHDDIPPRFGWHLLADPSADLPGVGLTRELNVELDFEFDEAYSDEAPEADFACGQIAAETDWEEAYPVDEWTTETADELATDEYDEDHLEEAPIHEAFADEEDMTEDVDDRESAEPEMLAELLDAGFAAEDDESASTDENATEVFGFEEFGGSEHKHIGDQASGNAHTTLRYGSPPQWLSFGDVVALAGDYFASYFDMNELARTPGGRVELAWARWHCMGLKAEGVAEPAAAPAQKKSVTDRYFALASRNLSHFSAGGNAVATYAKGHSDALVDALEAGQTGDKTIWRRALTKEAFADHFLTDAFSAGHVRTPRADIKQWYDTNMPGSNDALLHYMARFIFNRLDERQQLPPAVWWYGWISMLWGNELLQSDISKTGGEATNSFSVGDILSLAIHNHDNKGLDVVSAVDADGREIAGGYRWRAVGDGHLGLQHKSRTPARPNRCAPVFTPASALTTKMATAAVIASLRELERVRGIGVKLGKRQLSRSEGVGAIKQGITGKGFAALRFIPQADASSNKNSPLQSTRGSKTLDWRWGRLGEVAYRAVNETVQCQIADDLEALIPGVADPAIAKRAGLTFRIYGTRNAFRAFVKHLRTSGVKAIEDAVGKAAR
jgi:hypothetical protein